MKPKHGLKEVPLLLPRKIRSDKFFEDFMSRIKSCKFMLVCKPHNDLNYDKVRFKDVVGISNWISVKQKKCLVKLFEKKINITYVTPVYHKDKLLAFVAQIEKQPTKKVRRKHGRKKPNNR